MTKTAIITGANKGIGLAVAKNLISKNYHFDTKSKTRNNKLKQIYLTKIYQTIFTETNSHQSAARLQLLKTLEKLAKVTSEEDLLRIVGVEAGQAIAPLLNDIPKLTKLG